MGDHRPDPCMLACIMDVQPRGSDELELIMCKFKCGNYCYMMYIEVFHQHPYWSSGAGRHSGGGMPKKDFPLLT